MLVAVAVLASGCGSGGGSKSKTESPRAQAGAASAGAKRRQATRRHRRSARHRAARARAAGVSVCPPASRALKGVYHPARLRVIDHCRAVAGRVAVVHQEEDGDLHFDVALDPAYRNMLMPANYSRQHGYLVVEFMPRDRGRLPAPSVGDRIALVGAYVDDLDHAWSEIHPVWQVSINGGQAHRSGPRLGGSPAASLSYNALRTCRTRGGKACAGYGSGPSLAGVGGAGGKNCSDFSSRRAAQRYFLAHGGPARDPSGLDADHDGVACSSLPR